MTKLVEPVKVDSLNTLRFIREQMASGKIKYITEREAKEADYSEDVRFNMAYFKERYNCGTVCCIGGFMRELGAEPRQSTQEYRGYHERFHSLFFPRFADPTHPFARSWDKIPVSVALHAIDAFLETGTAEWRPE